MNISLFSDWLEERLFGEGNLAHLVADIVDEAMARDTPGEFTPSEKVDEGLLESALGAAENEDEILRARTAVVLGRLGYVGAAPGLDEARNCGDTSVARAAAICLARLRGADEELLAALVETVEDPTESREIRSAAAVTIARMNTASTTQTLARIARAEDPDLAQYGIEGLGHVKPEPASAEEGVTLQALLAALQSKDPMLRFPAVEALGDFGDGRAIKPLEMILIEKDPSIRRRSLFALAKLGADSAKAPLTRMLRDFSIPARWEIVDLLGEHYGESMVDALALAGQDRDAEIRDHVVAALGKMDGPESLRILQKMANEDADNFVREQALGALARRGADLAAAHPPPTPAAAPATAPTPQPEAVAEPAAAAAARPARAGKLQPLYGGAPPPPPEPHRESGNVIERALESMECTWWVDSQGYQVQVPHGKKKEKVAVLMGEVDFEESPIYRFVVSCGPAQGAALEAALRNNRHLDYGALAIADVAGGSVLVLTDTLLAGAATPASVRKTLTSLASAAGQLRG